MRRTGWIVAVALLGLVGCGPPCQTSIHVLDAGEAVQSLAFAPDGRTLACALRDRILLVDAESGARIRELGPVPEQFLSVAFSRDRLLSAGVAGYARLWDVSRGVEVDRFMAGEVRRLAISPDGRWLVTTPGAARGDGSVEGATAITIWDLDHDRRSPPITGFPGFATALAVSAEGLIAVGRTRVTIDVFEARSGKLLRTLRGEGANFQNVTSVAYNPDSPLRLAAGDDAGYITVWDVSEGHTLAHFRPHWPRFLGPTPRIVAASFALHGLLAEAGSQGAAAVWRFDPASGRNPRGLATFADPIEDWRSEIYALAMNRHGSLVATSHRDHNIRIWRGPAQR